MVVAEHDLQFGAVAEVNAKRLSWRPGPHFSVICCSRVEFVAANAIPLWD